MRNAFAIGRREFAAYFLTPVGYVTLGIFAVLAGYGFQSRFFEYMRLSQAPTDYGFTAVPDFEEYFLNPFLLYCGILVMFLTPLITMRLFAEERHRGTIEQLYTLPVRDWEMVAGKYGAAMGMVVVLMVVIGIDLAVVGAFTPMEPLILAAGLFSVLLMGVAFIALGLFISALTRNQMTAATLTFGILLGLFYVSDLVSDLPEANEGRADSDITRAAFVAYNVGRDAVSKLAADAHVKDLALGVVKPQDVAFYLLFAAVFLFLTMRALEARFWRS